MKDIIKKVYSKFYFYFPFFVKPIEYSYYYINNIFCDKRKYKDEMKEGKEILEKIIEDKNYYYVIIDKGIGDALIVAQYAHYLEQKYKKNIAFILKKEQIDIVNKFDYIKKIIGCSNEELQKIELYITRNSLYETDEYKYCFFEMKISKNGKRNWSSAHWNKKIMLSERYKKYVFSLSEEATAYKVNEERSLNCLKNIKEKYKIRNNSILLIPYANTVPHINNTFWEKLAIQISNKGYTVYTNIGNTKKEKPIQNTLGITMTLDEVFNVSKEFNSIITIRCGLAEYLGLTNPNMIVINDNSKNYDRWDDINTYSSKKTIKNIYINNKKNDILINEIISEIGG